MRCLLTLAILAILVTAHVSQAQPQKSKSAPLSPQNADSSAVQRYTPEDVVGVVAMQPSRMLKSKYLQTMVEAASGQKEMDEMMAFLTKELGMDPLTVQEVAILFDRETIDRALNPMKGSAGGTAQLKNNMKQIGLGFHNYHDVYNHFPAENGNGERGGGQKTGLSWRVYLLPFVEEAVLYNQFKMDEDWDSPHNKSLIEQMPAVFKVEGVDKPGFTSVHVLTGDDTAMGTDEGVGLRDITDGTSNTILAVVAGPDTAEVWTKPGGLKFNPDDPKKVLGKLGEEFLVLMCDGFVRYLKSDIEDDTLQKLIQRNDGMPVDLD